ncbi:hypothetical protein RB595_007431 [Gaeumannomyces hyphopodioides]
MAAIKRVTIVGASGALGVPVLEALVNAGAFEVTMLARTAGKVPAALASKTREVVVDYDSIPALTDALCGQDAVVSTVGRPGIAWQATHLVPAAVAAGVKRVLPSEFGCDLSQPAPRKFPTFAAKVQVQELLEAEAAKPGATISYTFVRTNAFLDWGLQAGLIADPKNKKATLYNGGSNPVSLTRLSTVGQAVVAVLQHLEETKNKQVFVHDGLLSMREIVAAAQEATGGAKGWTVAEEDTGAIKAKSDKALSEGVFEIWVFIGYILDAAWNAANKPNFADRSWNKALGIKEHGAEEMKGLVKEIVSEIVAGR